MKIVSPFHDYYDSVLSYGVDKSVVYDRQEKTVKVKLESSFYSEERTVKIQGYSFRMKSSKHVIGFCGKLYPLVQLTLTRTDTGTSSNYFFYDGEKLSAFMKKLGIKQDEYSYFGWRRYFRLSSERGMDAFFDPTTWKELGPAFYEHKVPVFVYTKDEKDRSYLLICNPQLKKYGFMKMKGSAAAFQDIYSYISGVLGVDAKPMVKLKDKELAEKKGHGGKYSFRKPPGKRGNPKWR